MQNQTAVCTGCGAVRAWKKGSVCPSCGSREARLYDVEGARRLHDLKQVEHKSGCEVCRHRRARKLASQLNDLMDQKDLPGVRKLVRENMDEALLSAEYVHYEFKHIVQTIVRQEIGVEPLPS